MTEYIEKEEAVWFLEQPITMSMCLTLDECHHKRSQRQIDCALVKKIPPADVVPVVHGEWIMLSYDEALCSCCGYVRGTDFDSTREARERWAELPPYCEQCGAKIDGGADHDD